MTKVVYYTQCRLQNGPWEQVAWIPTDLAVVGKTLEIRGTDGWKVIGRGATQPAEYLQAVESARRDRAATIR